MSKLISIIIPCYNVASYIDRCFKSLLAQTIGFDKLEIILIDDCSTDTTWAKLTAIEAAYPESVMIIHCDENGHQGTARNIGMEYASAPYIGFVDSDDWIEPDMYEKLYEKMITHHCDIVMCDNWRDYGFSPDLLEPKSTGKEDRLFQIDSVEKRKTFLACGSIGYGVWDKLYTRELLLDNNIFFPEHLAYEDHFFSILLYFYAKRVYMLEERLYHYFVNPASTVLTPNASHHFNILTVDMMMWAECEKRGFLNTYRKEVEYQFLCLCYLASLKMISLRLTELPYDFFLQLKEETLKRVPDYHAIPYIREYVTPLNQSLLGLLDYPISEQDLTTVCTSLRKNFIKNTLSIFIMTHVSFEPPQNPIYHPLHVGHAIHEDLGYPGDDTGDNISDQNMYYSELTGLYWAWKNVQNTEYIGLCHYRRYFLNEKHSVMNKADFMSILAKYQVILSQAASAEVSYRDTYAQAHNIHDLKAVGDAIAELYPDCTPIFQEVLSGNKLYCGNLFVTTKELFDDYAAWLFSIFNVASKQIDVSTYDDYHKRVYGFLSEQLLYVWVRYRNLTYYEAPIGFTQEKAETLSLKSQLSTLFKEQKIEEAHELFIKTTENRPDVMLPGSDFNEELTTILRIIHLCLEEKKQNKSSLLDYSTDLNELIAYYNKTYTNKAGNTQTGIKMRFVFFHEATDSFNYFSDEIAEELRRRGHETFTLDLIHADLPGHSLQEFTTFCTEKIDAVICIDRIGIHNDYYINLWNLMGTCAVNILMDHPLRFHPTMEKHPAKYIQLCPDTDHVAYVNKYFPEITHSEFLSHAGTPDHEPPIPYQDKKYDIFFSATYYSPDNRLHELEKNICPKDSPLYQIYMQIADYLLSHTDKTLEQSVIDVLSMNHMDLSNNACKTIMRGISPIDWMVRMHYREKVIKTLIDAGFSVHVLGRGWENHPCADNKNLHMISDRVRFVDTFSYMRDAKINLNVMPWFKAGTHDRIFNTMLRHSICLTDSSTWIDSHFTDKKDIALYDLNHLEQLPDIADYWLNHPTEAENLTTKAYNKASEKYTWKNCVDSILESLERNYQIR